jgi:DNA-binding NarL/FixJ family response regulator
VKRETSAFRIRVCLLWKHPMVLAEVRRVLSGEPFELLPVKIDSSSSSTLDGLLPPETLLYMIDGDALGSRTAALVTDVLAANPGARPVVMGDDLSEATAFSLLRLGTKGIVTCAEVMERLPRVLREVNTGGFWVPRTLLSRFVDSTREGSFAPRLPGRPAALTPREREILNDLLQNLSNKEIAKKHRISDRTAKFHVSNVLAKYGVKRRADLLLLSFPERTPSSEG